MLIMRADNRGEGGIVALLALLSARNAQPGTWRAQLLIVGLIGAALLYGDGAITPAISVLSAIEGLKVDAPSLTPVVVPLTIAILIGLFVMQKQGTGFIGKIFGPVMLGWFAVLALLGIHGIVKAPAVLAALSPLYAFEFLIHQDFRISFAILGAAFLAVTGGEAMYADMGHFGRNPIRLAWFAVALPALVLNYFGQAGLLITDRDARSTTRSIQLAPDWAHYPLVALRGGRHRDRLAGDHLRRVLADPAIDPARLPAADADHPHHQRRHRPDLCAAGELAAGGGDARRGDRFRHLGRAGGRLRHRGVAIDGDHHAAGRFGRDPVGLFAADRDRGERLLPGDRLHFLRGQLDKTGRRRLVSAAAGRLGGVSDADLAQRRQAGRDAPAANCASRKRT